MWEREPSEAWEYLSLPETKERVSDGHYIVLSSPNNTPLKKSLFVLPAYSGNGYNGYGAQPVGGESYTSQSMFSSLTGYRDK